MRRRAPTPGSKLRKLYDLFMANPMTPIPTTVLREITGGKSWRALGRQLDAYELDIRKHSIKRWWLVATEDRDYLGESVAKT